MNTLKKGGLMLSRLSRLAILSLLLICCEALAAASGDRFDESVQPTRENCLDTSDATAVKSPGLIAVLTESRRTPDDDDNTDFQHQVALLPVRRAKPSSIVVGFFVTLNVPKTQPHEQLSSVQQRGPPQNSLRAKIPVELARMDLSAKFI